MMMNVIKVKQDGEVWMERRIINFCNITLAREHIAIATLKALRHMLTTELTSIFRAVQPVHIMYKYHDQWHKMEKFKCCNFVGQRPVFCYPIVWKFQDLLPIYMHIVWRCFGHDFVKTWLPEKCVNIHEMETLEKENDREL